MKWINVNEKLPEHFESVLVWGKGYTVTECFYCDDYDWGVQGFYKDECGYDGEYPLIRDWVTHWMPLPKPPKV